MNVLELLTASGLSIISTFLVYIIWAIIVRKNKTPHKKSIPESELNRIMGYDFIKQITLAPTPTKKETESETLSANVHKHILSVTTASESELDDEINANGKQNTTTQQQDEDTDPAMQVDSWNIEQSHNYLDWLMSYDNDKEDIKEAESKQDEDRINAISDSLCDNELSEENEELKGLLIKVTNGK